MKKEMNMNKSKRKQNLGFASHKKGEVQTYGNEKYGKGNFTISYVIMNTQGIAHKTTQSSYKKLYYLKKRNKKK